MVILPWASLRNGELDPVDLENFPPYLKRLLIINMTILIISCGWMAVAVVLIELR